MFAGLHRFTEQEFVDEHPVFWFITPKYKLLYQIFSVTASNPYDQVLYGIDGYEYINNGEFETALEQFISSSLVKIEPVKKIDGRSYVMSLSTCTSDSSVRHVVHGVLLGNYTS